MRVIYASLLLIFVSFAASAQSFPGPLIDGNFGEGQIEVTGGTGAEVVFRMRLLRSPDNLFVVCGAYSIAGGGRLYRFAKDSLGDLEVRADNDMLFRGFDWMTEISSRDRFLGIQSTCRTTNVPFDPEANITTRLR